MIENISVARTISDVVPASASLILSPLHANPYDGPNLSRRRDRSVYMTLQRPSRMTFGKKAISKWWREPFFAHSPNPVVPITISGALPCWLLMQGEDIGSAFMKTELKTLPASMVATSKSMDFMPSPRALRKFFTSAKRSESLISNRHGSGSRIDHPATLRTPHNPCNKPSDHLVISPPTSSNRWMNTA